MDTVNRYLGLIEATLPERIAGLYLTGSIALGDYRPGQSDIDFVAVTDDRLSADELEMVEAVHRALQGEIPLPWFSGVYVTSEDLRREPEEIEAVPFILEGEFGRSGGFDANPATWLTLRNHPFIVRGPRPNVWYDPEAIRRWNRENLNTYWSGLLNQLEAAGDSLDGDRLSRAIAWCVPGVLRLQYTIAIGDVTSKAGACRYALETLPEEWHAIVRDALALREGRTPEQRDASVRSEELIALMRLVIDDSNSP